MDSGGATKPGEGKCVFVRPCPPSDIRVHTAEKNIAETARHAPIVRAAGQTSHQFPPLPPNGGDGHVNVYRPITRVIHLSTKQGGALMDKNTAEVLSYMRVVFGNGQLLAHARLMVERKRVIEYEDLILDTVAIARRLPGDTPQRLVGAIERALSGGE